MRDATLIAQALMAVQDAILNSTVKVLEGLNRLSPTPLSEEDLDASTHSMLCNSEYADVVDAELTIRQNGCNNCQHEECVCL